MVYIMILYLKIKTIQYLSLQQTYSRQNMFITEQDL